jgi:hypothetical protein
MIVSDSDVELTSGLKCKVAQLAVDTRHTADQHGTDTIAPNRFLRFLSSPLWQPEKPGGEPRRNGWGWALSADTQASTAARCDTCAGPFP